MSETETPEDRERADAAYRAGEAAWAIEHEAWKVAQLAAVLWAGNAAGNAAGHRANWTFSSCVADAGALLAEARHQVAAEAGEG